MRVKEAVRKKVRFYREEVNKKKSLVGWRKPKGIHNKSRLRKQRHSLLPKIGYAGAKVGKNLIYVMTINDLNKLNKENDVIILSGKLGMKKRIIMLEEIKKNGFILYNYRDLGVKKKELEEKINKRKNENKQKQEKRSKTKEELKEIKEKKKEELDKTDEEKKKEMNKKAIEGI
ncbi:MAG TPA: eL32 family ribosomal protein [Candidatus Nanoarchaeia archaeon]|nr:eL32 family ribosomal protein [Candidatus Nanoarchaeia archaeon]